MPLLPTRKNTSRTAAPEPKKEPIKPGASTDSPDPAIPAGAKKEEIAIRDAGFVPLAIYWLDPERSGQLTEFVDAIDEVCAQLRNTFNFVFGTTTGDSLSLQRLDLEAADLGIWEKSDSVLWRRCLRLRRDIMSEGDVPISAEKLAQHSRWLKQLNSKLSHHELDASTRDN